jgi:hypothetical protein
LSGTNWGGTNNWRRSFRLWYAEEEMMVADMLELTARSDLIQLDDVGLADRLDRAWQANESAKKRYGWRYYLYLFNWMPRALVQDPYDYWYPSQILGEIRAITAEIERRVQVRKNVGI